ncbi:MAG TPA: GtrA family protein [Acidimicrobiales bacterium]|nr:GtrA family protein [Acidimicrobiales bacterium]
MPKRLRDLLAWARTHEGKKVLRFTSVSVVSTAVSFTSISVLYGFHIVKGVIWATVIGNLIATLPSYYLNRTWTWGKRGRSHFLSEIVPFWSMSFLGIGVSMLGAAWAREQVREHQWAHIVNTALVSFTNLFSFGLFWMLKMMVFNRIFHDHTLEEMDEHLTAEESRI